MFVLWILMCYVVDIIPITYLLLIKDQGKLMGEKSFRKYLIYEKGLQFAKLWHIPNTRANTLNQIQHKSLVFNILQSSLDSRIVYFAALLPGRYYVHKQINYSNLQRNIFVNYELWPKGYEQYDREMLLINGLWNISVVILTFL